MADNFQLTDFDGDPVTVASKEVSGSVHHIRHAFSVWTGSAFGDLTYGQALMAASVPVVIASNQSAVPVSGTFYQATQPVSIAATVTVDTELPAAVTLADNLTNPTAPMVGADLLVFDSTNSQWSRLRVPTKRGDVSTVAIGSIATVLTPSSGKKFRLFAVYISVSAAVSVLFEDNSAGGGNFIFRTPKLVADTPFIFEIPNGFLSAAANNVLKATASASANLLGTLIYAEET